VTLEAHAMMKVSGVADLVEEKEGIPVGQQRLLFAGKQLDQLDRQLSDYCIREESTIYVILRLRGELPI
jgi:hypothetical protein